MIVTVRVVDDLNAKKLEVLDTLIELKYISSLNNVAWWRCNKIDFMCSKCALKILRCTDISRELPSEGAGHRHGLAQVNLVILSILHCHLTQTHLNIQIFLKIYIRSRLSDTDILHSFC